MGAGGISVWQLLIILVIVLLLFGTKRLKNIGSDLGNAVKGFRGAMAQAEKDDEDATEARRIDQNTRQSASASGVDADRCRSDEANPRV